MVDTLNWKERARRGVCQHAGARIRGKKPRGAELTHLAERHQPQQDRMKTKYFGKGEVRVRCVSDQRKQRSTNNKQVRQPTRRGVRRRHSRVSLHVRSCIGCA